MSEDKRAIRRPLLLTAQALVGLCVIAGCYNDPGLRDFPPMPSDILQNRSDLRVLLLYENNTNGNPAPIHPPCTDFAVATCGSSPAVITSTEIYEICDLTSNAWDIVPNVNITVTAQPLSMGSDGGADQLCGTPVTGSQAISVVQCGIALCTSGDAETSTSICTFEQILDCGFFQRGQLPLSRWNQ
jgi:hypothetical protein